MTERAQKGQDAQMGDGELLLRAQGGDMSAFEALVEQHRDGAYGLGLQITRSEIDAAEVAQETFLCACINLKEFRNEADLGACVQRIAVNLALRRLQQRSNGPAGKDELKLPAFNERGGFAEHPETDWSGVANDKPLKADLRRAIQEAANRLPQYYRQVFLFKDVVGLTYEEIAEIAGESIAAIQRRLHLARLSLREEIDRFLRGQSRRRTSPVTYCL
jgi:RNA polymerase sigma-70 factor, ECF subfamily